MILTAPSKLTFTALNFRNLIAFAWEFFLNDNSCKLKLIKYSRGVLFFDHFKSLIMEESPYMEADAVRYTNSNVRTLQRGNNQPSVNIPGK